MRGRTNSCSTSSEGSSSKLRRRSSSRRIRETCKCCGTHVQEEALTAVLVGSLISSVVVIQSYFSGRELCLLHARRSVEAKRLSATEHLDKAMFFLATFGKEEEGGEEERRRRKKMAKQNIK